MNIQGLLRSILQFGHVIPWNLQLSFVVSFNVELELLQENRWKWGKKTDICFHCVPIYIWMSEYNNFNFLFAQLLLEIVTVYLSINGPFTEQRVKQKRILQFLSCKSACFLLKNKTKITFQFICIELYLLPIEIEKKMVFIIILTSIYFSLPFYSKINET